VFLIKDEVLSLGILLILINWNIVEIKDTLNVKVKFVKI